MTISTLCITICACYSFVILGFEKSFGQKVHEIESRFTISKGRKRS